MQKKKLKVKKLNNVNNKNKDKIEQNKKIARVKRSGNDFQSKSLFKVAQIDRYR